MITRMIHVNVVSTDLKKSLKFYCDLLGGKVLHSSKGESTEAGITFGFGRKAKWDACYIRLGEDKRSPFIDLVQWIEPASTGKPYDKLNNAGIPRIAFAVDDIEKTYNDLKAKGVVFISPPQEVDTGDVVAKMVTCKDPDGTAIEFIQTLP